MEIGLIKEKDFRDSDVVSFTDVEENNLDDSLEAMIAVKPNQQSTLEELNKPNYFSCQPIHAEKMKIAIQNRSVKLKKLLKKVILTSYDNSGSVTTSGKEPMISNKETKVQFDKRLIGEKLKRQELERKEEQKLIQQKKELVSRIIGTIGDLDRRFESLHNRHDINSKNKYKKKHDNSMMHSDNRSISDKKDAKLDVISNIRFIDQLDPIKQQAARLNLFTIYK